MFDVNYIQIVAVERGVKTFMRKTLLWLIVVLVMGVIFLSSHEPAAASRQDTLFTTDIIMEFLHSMFPTLSVDGDSVHHIIRNSAHFIIYVTLGVCTFAACLQNRKAVSYNVILTIVMCVLYAISDEIH